MAEGFSAATANAVLNAICQNVSYAQPALYLQVHVGAPGAAGTANVAAETTRVNMTGSFGTAASGGSIANTVAASWTSVPAAETWTRVSLWTAATGGSFICSGSVTANAVAAGDNVTIPVGDITLSLTVAS